MKSVVVLFIVSLCCFSGVEAQNTKRREVFRSNKPVLFFKENGQRFDLDSRGLMPLGKYRILRRDSLRKGETLTVKVEWDLMTIDSVIFDTFLYRVTREDIRNRKYTFTITPEKSMLIQWVMYNGGIVNKVKTSHEFKKILRVVDERGEEIRDKEFTVEDLKIKEHHLPQKIVPSSVAFFKQRQYFRTPFYNPVSGFLFMGDALRKGESLTVEVEWDPTFTKKIVVDTAFYRVTREDLKRQKYTFTITPEKTTVFRYVVDSRAYEKSSGIKIFRVVDDLGNDIVEGGSTIEDFIKEVYTKHEEERKASERRR